MKSEQHIISLCILVFLFCGMVYFISKLKNQKMEDLHLRDVDELRILITVNFSSSLHCTDPKFLSLAIDSSLVRKNFSGFDFSSEKLQNMAAALSPTELRLGGTDADFLIFDPTSPSAAMDSNINGYTHFLLTGKQWDTVTSFFQKAGWDLMFDFNLFKWKEDGLWDPSNVNLLLNYSAARSIDIPYFQLGNEPSAFDNNFNLTLPPDVLVKDFRILKQLISNYKQYAGALLYGPDVSNIHEQGSARQYFELFVQAEGYDVVDEYSLHHYYCDGKIATNNTFLNFTVMNSFKTFLQMSLSISQSGAKPLPIRLTETSSCYDGGTPGLSNAYAAGFLWLDKLGLAAQYGVTRVFRQTFYGASYALISQSLDPDPDFYLSVLFKRLVEGHVYNVMLDPPLPQVRVYAQCARKNLYPQGALVIYYLNLGNTATVLSFTQFASNDLDLYLLTPGDDKGLNSRFIKLNGQVLKMSGSALPPLQPLSHKGDVTVEAHSYGFVVIQSAFAYLCL